MTPLRRWWLAAVPAALLLLMVWSGFSTVRATEPLSRYVQRLQPLEKAPVPPLVPLPDQAIAAVDPSVSEADFSLVVTLADGRRLAVRGGRTSRLSPTHLVASVHSFRDRAAVRFPLAADPLLGPGAYEATRWEEQGAFYEVVAPTGQRPRIIELAVLTQVAVASQRDLLLVYAGYGSVAAVFALIGLQALRRTWSALAARGLQSTSQEPQ